MSLTVRERYALQQFMDEKHTAMGNRIPGVPLFVLPGTAATHLAFMRDRHKRVYTDLATALAAATAGRGDVLVLAPGDHTVSTASLAMSKAGVMIVGPEAWMGRDYPGMKSVATLTTDIAGDEIINVTAADCAIIGVTLIPITQSDALDVSSAAHRFKLINCHIDLNTPAVHTSTIGITLAAASHIVVRGNTFQSDGAQGNAIVATASVAATIEQNTFLNTAGTWASAIVCGAATAACEIAFNRFMCYGTAMTVGIDGTGATLASGVWIHDNRAGSLVTKLVDNFDAGEAEISENYDSGVGAADGGVLVTAIT